MGTHLDSCTRYLADIFSLNLWPHHHSCCLPTALNASWIQEGDLNFPICKGDQHPTVLSAALSEILPGLSIQGMLTAAGPVSPLPGGDSVHWYPPCRVPSLHLTSLTPTGSFWILHRPSSTCFRVGSWGKPKLNQCSLYVGFLTASIVSGSFHTVLQLYPIINGTAPLNRTVVTSRTLHVYLLRPFLSLVCVNS